MATSSSVYEAIVTYNKIAMTSLSTESFKECLLYLRRAEELIQDTRQKMVLSANSKQFQEEISKLYSLTLNNLGCYYKK